MSTIAVVLIAIAALAVLAAVYVAVLSPKRGRDDHEPEHTPKNIDRAGPDEETTRPNRPASVADRDGERRPAPAQRW